MPVPIAHRIKAVARELGTQRRLAEALGVDPAQVTRWVQGGGMGPLNRARLGMLEVVMSRLAGLYEPAVIEDWLLGANPHLGDRQPLQALGQGEFEAVLGAIRQEEGGSFA